MQDLFRFLRTRLVFESLLSIFFDVTALDIALGIGRGSECVSDFTLRAPFWSCQGHAIPHFSSAAIALVAGNGFSDYWGREINLTGGFTTQVLVADMPIKARRK